MVLNFYKNVELQLNNSDHEVSDQYLNAYANAYYEWVNDGREDFFLNWLVDKYGVEYIIVSRTITNVTVIDEKKHFIFLIKHSS